MQVLRFSLLIALIVTLHSVLTAQHVRLTHYNTENGLIQNQILTLFTDRQNLLWIGTKGGVSRFDGLNFKNYTEDNGLFSGDVTFITQDSKGAIWVGRKYGLSKIHKNIVSNYNFPKTSKLTHYYNTKAGIVCESYVADQIVYYLFKNNTYRVIHELTDGPEYSFVERERIQIQTMKGNSYSVDISDGSLRDRMPTKKRIHAQNNFATYYTDTDSVEFAYLNGKKYFYPFPPGQHFHIVEFTPGNFVWTSNGITKIYNNYKLVETLENFVFSTAEHTREGFYFFGTETGLYVLSNFAFKHFETGTNGLNHEIWSMANFNDTIWVIANAGQAYYLKNNKFVQTDLQLTQTDFFNFGHIPFQGHYAWTTHHGLEVKDLKTGSFTKVPLNASGMSMAVDSAKKMHLIGTTAGLITLDFDKDWQVFDNYNTRFTGRNWLHSSILSIVKDTAQVTWLTTNSGLAALKNDSINYFTDSIFRSGAIASIIDSKNNIWFGGKGGLIHYNYNTFKRINFDILKTVMGDITSLFFINKTDLLIGTTRGLAMLDVQKFYETGKIRAAWFDRRVGFAGTECQQNNMLLTSDTTLWIPMTDRIVCVNPKLLTYIDEITKPVWLEIHAEIEGKGFAADTMFPNFPADYNNLRLEFTLPDFVNSQNIRFKYRLTGKSVITSEIFSERFVHFTNLASGNYSLELFYSNGQGVWAAEPEKINFTIAYKWHENPINITIAIFTLSVLIAIAIRLYRQKMKQKRIENERIKQATARNFLSMVSMQLDPHFIFNIMTIAGNEAVKQKSMNDYIAMVELSELLRQHWAAKELIRPLESEIDFVNAYLSLVKRLHGNRFSWKVNANEVNDFKTPIIKQSIVLFVENAIKHGIEQRKEGGEINVNFIDEPTGLVIRISDNGIGLKASKEQKKTKTESRGLGINKFQEIIEFFNRENLHKITFNVTDISDTQPTEHGTLVEIYYPKEYKFITY